ncbi:amidase, Asp-tRNAAsn/Glu-tRNAGln amidotransferase A subunit [Frankia torreyi]|uniref:Amidase, Asp-tRNAAsn/Glu-tRNAGln amidotransferase A subunit n=2 Tax=Frankia TaxID=1854 RepID=A0A0D8BF75_9ACTN|nr:MULTISPECIES: amidase [Frankia]KJE22928.1 amidase, Asp-tRNAAsn/Glu-tRNAGln amidotransferase A subunit [Frankia torreyi]
MNHVRREYPALGATELAALVRAGLIAPQAPVEAALTRLRETDGALRAFTSCWPAWAAYRASLVSRALARGAELPLAGVPIAVKAGSDVTAPTTRRLLAAGAIVIGATAVPIRTAHPWQTWGHTTRGPTVNPWRPDRVPGGSSAGSAVAVASGVVPLATAADGAGSTRIPAAWCGVVGLKPTNGRFPGPDRAGLTVPGPIVRHAADAAAWWAVVAGASEVPPVVPPGGKREGGRLGIAVWSSTLGFARPEPEVVAVSRAAADRLAAAGVLAWTDVPVELLDPEAAWTALRAASAGPGTAAAGTAAAGTAAVGTAAAGTAAASNAAAVRAHNDRCLAGVLARADVLLTPTTPNRPHPHAGPGEVRSVSLTWAFNLSGQPAVSVPAGFTADGCPVGLQIVGRHGEEGRLLRLVAALERLVPWPSPAPDRWTG